jgi:hypothetical protein
MDRIRTAVVGVGAFGQNHARVLAGLPQAELVAVVDASAARAQEIAAKYGCAAFTDYRQLIGKADAVCVAAPTVSHAEVGVALLEAGLDVLVEKPLAANLDAPINDQRGGEEQSHSASRPPGALQPGRRGSHQGGRAAAVLRSAPPEHVRAAQPGHRRCA